MSVLFESFARKAVLPFAIAFFSSLTLASQGNEGELSAEKIYKQSVNMFTFKQMLFEVNSETHFDKSVSEKRRFLVASQRMTEDEQNLLIRFLKPKEIQCTSILLNNRADSMQRYVYFPSLNRIRVVPESDGQKEVLGMGITYEEMTQPKGRFLPVETVTLGNKSVYKLTLEDDGKRIFTWVDQVSLQLIKIEVFEQTELQKRVLVDKVKKVAGDNIILAWSIEDFIKQRRIDYEVDEETIQRQVDTALFRKNLLKRCRLS